MPRLIAIAIVGLMFAGQAGAQPPAAYPDRPVKIVMPFPPGGPTDTIARLLADQLRITFKQPFVVENKAGAGGNIGLGEAARAPKDGYTLAIITATTSAINPALYPTLPYDPDKDFVTVAVFAKVAYALVARPGIPANNLGELAALIRARPGALNGGYASTASQVANDLFMKAAGAKFLSVPYKGDANVHTALMSGEVDLYFTVSQQAGPLVSAGKLKGIAVASAQRTPIMPNVPTFAEAGMPGFFDLTAWFGLVTNAGVPNEIVVSLNREINRIVSTPEFAARFAQFGFFPVTHAQQEAHDFVRTERARWGKAVRDSGAKVD
jgi:tripartite-type tricarboxylate transporter receptor subunit TctC